jgi:hypothetical protein
VLDRSVGAVEQVPLDDLGRCRAGGALDQVEAACLVVVLQSVVAVLLCADLHAERL